MCFAVGSWPEGLGSWCAGSFVSRTSGSGSVLWGRDGHCCLGAPLQRVLKSVCHGQGATQEGLLGAEEQVWVRGSPSQDWCFGSPVHREKLWPLPPCLTLCISFSLMLMVPFNFFSPFRCNFFVC